MCSEHKVLKAEVSEELLTPALTIVEEEGSDAEENQITSPSALIDTNIDTTDADDVQYDFGGDAVTYRVVQLGESVEELSATTITHNSAGVQQTAQPVQALYTEGPNGGLFVIGPPHEVFPINATGQKTYIPKLEENIRPTITVCIRDDRRRATHNEVERRRRDKINSWIVKLGKIIPDCKQESVKGSFESQSKGGILAKACNYIAELRESNQRLMSYAKENEHLMLEVDTLAQKCDRLEAENDKLRALLRQNGVTIV
ncbi:hypothetical protein O3M35_000481 [Rhynocoris fuscipes]|uniref:BHLH domain-containing protein n=1 Tax=Rhynocoris fuscipes TaxID=488301 RepID=A0AAW1DMD2_9HEMI